MPELVFEPRTPAEAVDYLERKSVGGRFSFDWRDVWREEHLNSFVVAKAMQADLLADIHGGLTAALRDGWTSERFIQELTPMLQARGWWGKKRMVDPATGEERLVTLGTPRRLRVIFDTNMRMAHSAGRWERFMRSAKTRPFGVYHHTPQEHPREQHQAWDGITLPWTHAFWRTHYTPNGWGCKCYTTSARQAQVTSEDELKRRGVYDQVPWTNKRTGETTMVPKGIDKGFDYNVGQARLSGLAPPLMPEPQRGYVQGDRQPRALPPLRVARPLPADVKVRPDLAADPVAVFEAMSKVIGKGEGEVFIDRAQVPLVVGRRMFEQHDQAGEPIGSKPGLGSRAELAEIFGATLRDPDEIWMSLQQRDDGTSVMVRTFIAAFDATQDVGRQLFVLAFHEGAQRGVWMGTTAFGPGKRGKPRTQEAATSQGFRIGTLVYRRK
ncbi:phage minor head protein [Phenylobacterium sp.]|uniref:phage minor head protein n=1 Tax=Phenylobacterium sp. TaxID=1871053 RepID=UPI0035AE03BD